MKVVLIDSEWSVPSPEFVDYVQNEIDPVGHQGQGIGLAPIGHVVTVAAVTGVEIDVSFTLTFDTGYTWEAVQEDVKNAIKSYFVDLAKSWADSTNLIVRVSQIETKVLNVEGVIDIAGTKINGGTANISLDATSIPVLGVVTNGTA